MTLPAPEGRRPRLLRTIRPGPPSLARDAPPVPGRPGPPSLAPEAPPRPSGNARPGPAAHAPIDPPRRSPAIRFVRRAALVLTLAVVVVLETAGPAFAHASLVSVDPPDGARLDESPATVTLTFSESVSADLGGVRVLDSDGTPVQEGAARFDGVTVTVDLAPISPRAPT